MRAKVPSWLAKHTKLGWLKHDKLPSSVAKTHAKVPSSVAKMHCMCLFFFFSPLSFKKVWTFPSGSCQRSTLCYVNTRQWRSPPRITAAARLVIGSEDESTFFNLERLKVIWVLLLSVNSTQSEQNLMWLWSLKKEQRIQDFLTGSRRKSRKSCQARDRCSRSTFGCYYQEFGTKLCIFNEM